MFKALTGIPSYHEPVPLCIGDTLEEVNNVPFDELSPHVEAELQSKIHTIKTYTNGWYMESSQMFIKSYVDEVLENFDDVYCIYLHRNPIETTMSYWKKLGHKRDTDYFLESHWKKNILRTREPLEYWDNVLWNCYEVRERYLAYKPRFTKTWELDFLSLNDPLEWAKLLRHFGLFKGDLRELPDLKRNALEMEDELVLRKLREEWTLPGVRKFSVFPMGVKV